MPLCPIFAFQDSYQQIRICDVPKRIGEWQIKRVEVECQFPDNQATSYECSLVGGVWTTTIESCSTAGTTKNGFAVNGFDESGNKYILGKSDLYILTNDSRVIPQKALDVVNILPGKPETPHVGDAVFVDGKLEVFDGENWISTGSGVIESTDVPGYAENAVSANNAQTADYAQNAENAVHANSTDFSDIAELAYNAQHASFADGVYWMDVEGKPNIPSKTSDLENDEDFVDRDFVNSSIATNTAHFLGTFDDSDDFPTTATPNDYVFYRTFDVHGNTLFKRYKWGEIDDGYGWMYEYTLNNSSFTAEQWETINGGPYATQNDIDSIQQNIGAIHEELSYKATTDYVDSQIGQVLNEEEF